MTKDEAIKSFRHAYPNLDTNCIAQNINYNHVLIKASLSNGEKYYIVTDSTVSHAYNSIDDALRSI